MNKMPRTLNSAAENDNINIDEAILYENALKNLQREIDDKQKILSKLQVKINPQPPYDASMIYQKSYDENDYLKNKDAVQRIKDQAADVLIGELKSITSNLKRKLSDIDEKERRINSRLIELEERQAILEEIDYVQRMIPKKIIDEKINKSVQIKQELDIDIEEMFKPAVSVIADKTINKHTKGIKIINEDKKSEPQIIDKEENTETKQVIAQEERIEIESKKEPKQEKTAKIELPKEIQQAILEKIKSSQAEPKKEIVNKDKQEPVGKIDSAVKEEEENKLKIDSQNQTLQTAIQQKPVKETNKIASEEQSNIKAHSEITKKEPAMKSKPEQINSAAVNVLARDARSKISINAKPERKGMHIQQRNWKNFAYIKDSKIKLKQDDLLNISKVIMDIEQGKFSLKGI